MIDGIEIIRQRYDELVKAEGQIETIKNWIEGKTSYCNYVDVTDLKILLGIKKEETKNE